MSYIPDQVYDHIRYSSGGDAAGPCARMGNYTLHQTTPLDSHSYVHACKNGRHVSLCLVPQSKTEDWEILA